MLQRPRDREPGKQRTREDETTRIKNGSGRLSEIELLSSFRLVVGVFGIETDERGMGHGRSYCDVLLLTVKVAWATLVELGMRGGYDVQRL